MNELTDIQVGIIFFASHSIITAIALHRMVKAKRKRTVLISYFIIGIIAVWYIIVLQQKGVNLKHLIKDKE